MVDSNPLYSDERFFRLMVQVSPAGMLIVDGDGRIVLVNRKALELFGYEQEELLGGSVGQLLPEAHQCAHVSLMARYMSHPQPRSMAAGRDLFARRKDGSQFPVDISLHPLATEAGTFVLANVLDATQRKQQERDAERRYATERLLLLGQLAGGVAHEIRTPLCVIRNDVYYLQTLGEALGPEGVECVEEINQAVGKANRIVSELLDFTRDPPTNLQPVSLEEILQEALIDYQIPTGVQFQCSNKVGEVQVRADKEQVARILANLFRNAVQAMQGAGELRLAVSTLAEDVVLEILDTGPGIPADKLEFIFEPLYTTRPAGIGLGLAVSRRYARRNHGDLVATNSDEGGACFRLTLPMMREGAIPTGQPQEIDPI
jgi:two-component system, LuxR family, sensor kinase FixL